MEHTELELEHSGQKAALPGTRKHGTGAWKRQYFRQEQICAFGGLSTSAFLIACVGGDTLLFKGQMSQEAESAILEKSLESTLPDLASTGTPALYSLP